jgi:N-acetyl-anhydromuramyl-L-alanine amidase AmpD
MKMKINRTIREKYTPGFLRPSKPIEIVIHGTGGGASADVMIKWIEAGERATEYVKGIALFHYLVDFDGTTTEIISPDNWVYHSSSGSHDQLTIGIELMNKSAGNTNGYTDLQYGCLFNLITDLMDKYPIKSIVGHGYNDLKYSGTDKACPGNFDWARLGEFLKANYEVDYEPRHYTIKGA